MYGRFRNITHHNRNRVWVGGKMKTVDMYNTIDKIENETVPIITKVIRDMVIGQ